MPGNIPTPFWKNLRFDITGFATSLFVFIVLTFVWTQICVTTNEFEDYGEGFTSGLGYLLILSLSICVIQRKNMFGLLGRITLLVILLFGVSFLLGLAIMGLTGSMKVYGIVNSFFVAAIMVFSLDKFIGIDFRKMTVVATALCLLVFYMLMGSRDDRMRNDYGLTQRMQMFIGFHVLLIIPLTIGLSLKKKQ